MAALRRRSAISLTLLVGLGLSLVAACRKTHAPPSEEITVWQRRGVWTGRGVTQTEPFLIDSGLLRLTWEARGSATNPAAMFRITVHSDVSGRPLVVAVDRHGPGRDVTYVTEDPRPFFLVIESTDLDYSVDVAEGISAKRLK